MPLWQQPVGRPTLCLGGGCRPGALCSMRGVSKYGTAAASPRGDTTAPRASHCSSGETTARRRRWLPLRLPHHLIDSVSSPRRVASSGGPVQQGRGALFPAPATPGLHSAPPRFFVCTFGGEGHRRTAPAVGFGPLLQRSGCVVAGAGEKCIPMVHQPSIPTSYPKGRSHPQSSIPPLVIRRRPLLPVDDFCRRTSA